MADADSSFSQLLQPKQDLQQQEQETKNQLFVAASVPASLDARYKSEDVKPPPNFAEVELAMTDAEKAKHGNCGKVYSDPQFFFSEWEKEEEVRYRKQMEAKAQRKKEKKARKAKEKALKEKERGLAKQKTVTAKKALNWKNRYNLDDVGNMRVEQTISQANNLNLVSTRQLETGNVGLNTVDKESSVAQAMRAGGERGGVGGVGGGGGEGGGVSGVGGGGAATRPPPPPKKAGGGGGGGGQPPPPPKRNVPPPVREEEEEFYAAPSQQSTGGFKPPPPPRREVVQDAPAPAPAPPPKRPMPAKTVMPKSALDMSVLSGISGGGFQLKKAAPIVKKVDPKMNLLASIKKQQGGGLKKVDQEKVKAERRASTKALETGGGACSAVLAGELTPYWKGGNFWPRKATTAAVTRIGIEEVRKLWIR